MKLNPRRVSRYYYLRFIRLQGTPYSLAMGSALGASIAVTPTLPLHTVCIIAAQYYLSWKVGNMILPGRLDWNQLHELLILVREASFVEGIKIMGRLGFDAMLFRFIVYFMLNGGYTGQPSMRAGSREHTAKQRKCHNETRISHR